MTDSTLEQHRHRGGYREGSGRKSMHEADKRKRMTYTLSLEVIEYLRRHRPASRALEEIVRKAMAESVD